MLILISVIIVFVLLIWNSKLSFLKMRKGIEPIMATVVTYRKERNPQSNDYTLLHYPYVSFDENSDRLVRLKYANSASKPFKIGEEVKVFWYNGILYYWDSFDTGFYKYFPESIKFRTS